MKMPKYNKSFGQRLSRAFEDSDEGVGPLVIFVRNTLALVVLPIAMIIVLLLVIGVILSPLIVGWVVFF